MSAVVNIGILVVVIIGVLGGLKRGLRRELLNLAGIVIAIVGGILLAKPVASLFRSWGVIEEVPYLLAFVCGFILVSLGYSMIKGRMLPREIDLSERISGAMLGFAKGLIVAAILVYALVGIWPQTAEAVGRAPTARIVLPLTAAIDALAGAIRPLLPEEMTEQIRGGYRFFDQTRKDLKQTLETAAADSLSRLIEPPPR
ncbi:MAG: CvpA family protein [Candidatus Latescibacteria bacterium]|nr:CvpA family protein [Candidatus Latescibacterota bacterium]